MLPVLRGSNIDTSSYWRIMMDDLTEFFMTGYMVLPTMLGAGLDSLDIFAVTNLIMFLLFFVVALRPKSDDTDKQDEE